MMDPLFQVEIGKVKGEATPLQKPRPSCQSPSVDGFPHPHRYAAYPRVMTTLPRLRTVSVPPEILEFPCASA